MYLTVRIFPCLKGTKVTSYVDRKLMAIMVQVGLRCLTNSRRTMHLLHCVFIFVNLFEAVSSHPLDRDSSMNSHRPVHSISMDASSLKFNISSQKGRTNQDIFAFPSGDISGKSTSQWHDDRINLSRQIKPVNRENADKEIPIRTGSGESPYGLDVCTEASLTEDCSFTTKRCKPFQDSPCHSKLKPGIPSEESEQVFKGRKRTWKYCLNITGCFCYKNAVSCCADLSAIPVLDKTIKYLEITGNNTLTDLTASTFESCSQLKWLVLSGTSTERIDKDAFRNLTSLQHLELTHNDRGIHLEPSNFTLAVNELNGTLHFLALNNTAFAKPTGTQEDGLTYVIKNLKLPNLTSLFVPGNPRTEFYLSDVHHLPELCQLSLKDSRLEQLHSCRTSNPCQNISFPNLKLLDLANNSLIRVPNFCATNRSEVSVVPNMTLLRLSINAIVNPRRADFACMPELTSLALTGNPLKYLKSGMFQAMGKLTHLDLRFTNVMQAEAGAFNHSSLTSLTIESSNWFMDDEHATCCISEDIFQGSQLQEIDLSYNVFAYTKMKKVNNTLAPLSATATQLKMTEVGLHSIPTIITESFLSLQELGFKRNLVSTFPNLSNLSSLQSLDMRGCELTSFGEEEMEHLNQLLDKGVNIRLGNNAFSCSCDMLPFIDLYKENIRPGPKGNETGLFVGKPSSYKCSSPLSRQDQRLMDVDLTTHKCLLTIAQEILIYVFCLLFILSLLCYALLYRYRWQVRFWIYSLHVRLSRPTPAPRPEGQGRPGRGERSRSRPRFTAFVSYCREDSHFVLTQVLPTLERNRRLPLCIHERDFIPGKYISQNVVERMEESGHVLLVLSNASLANDWCRFELFVAQRYCLIHRRIPVTTLLLEPLKMELMDAHVITMLQSQPKIQWPHAETQNRQALQHFWHRLGQSLEDRRRN